MNQKQPNIILIMTDQQRFNTINALGASFMKTPNLDKLAKRSVSLDQCYCTAPSCVPSRASFFNMLYPHETGVYHNGCRWEHSWVEQFQEAGYHTVNVGKMHTVPMETPCGFDQRFIVENKDRPFGNNPSHGIPYDEWDKFLNSSGMRKPSRVTYRDEHPDYQTSLGAYPWPLDEPYHPDTFVGTMAKWFIQQRTTQKPLFLMVGFPGPHPPYDPPQRFLDQYEGVEFPVYEVTDDELTHQPAAHKRFRQGMIDNNHDAVRWHEKPSAEQLQNLHRHYAANVTLIDEQVGQILEELDKKGYLENAVVVFTSDHGDCLGDHGHIQKWTMYDAVTRTPTLISAPGRIDEDSHCDALLQHMDWAPLLLSFAGIEVPEGKSAINALDVIQGKHPGREYVFSEHTADNLLKGVEMMTMVRNRDWKLVHYKNDDEGELYDLNADSAEVHNLWHVADYASQKAQLITVIENWRNQSPPVPPSS